MMPMILAIGVPAGMAISVMLLESSIGRIPMGEVIVVGGGDGDGPCRHRLSMLVGTGMPGVVGAASAGRKCGA
jgi:hypothetical protein